MAVETVLHYLTRRYKGGSTPVLAKLRLDRHFRSTLCSNEQPEDAGAKAPAA